MDAHPLLLEIGTEELPPSSLQTLGMALRDGVLAALDARQLAHGAVHWFATPRRLAVLVEELAATAPARELEILGPPAERARNANGSWTPAAEGFARKQGLQPDDLAVITTDKGDRLGLRKSEPGAIARDEIAAVMASAIEQLPIAKRMRWGSGRAEFVRPVQWLLALYGHDSDLTPADPAARPFGLAMGNTTYGHRFHSPKAIVVTDPMQYRELLRTAHVIADFNERRELVRRQVIACADKLGAVAVIDEALLDEVAALVEWPVALAGSFEPRFLAVPAEALISSMKNHQKYFHVVDDRGALQPHFITVANLESREPQRIVAGNERVIRPRLSDAAFFFDTDRKRPLAARLEQLEQVVFQQQLGTVADKSRRVQALCGVLAPLIGADPVAAGRAAELGKADLVTELVSEFAELQGIAGYYYASHDGETAEVAAAIRDQYLPRFAGDVVPSAPVSVTLAVAERLDTLVGIFGIGQAPTGSRDPFALRRAALAVLRILVENAVDLDLHDALAAAAAQFTEGSLQEGTVTRVMTYMLERFRAWYEDMGIPVAVFRAVAATGPRAPLDIQRRVLAVHQFYQLPEAAALAAANKRVANILEKQGGDAARGPIDPDLLQEGAEQRLASAMTALSEPLAAALAAGDFGGAMAQLATLRESVDQFFDDVMVMAEDAAVRSNRLRLLQQLRDLFLRVADVSELAVAA